MITYFYDHVKNLIGTGSTKDIIPVTGDFVSIGDKVYRVSSCNIVYDEDEKELIGKALIYTCREIDGLERNRLPEL